MRKVRRADKTAELLKEIDRLRALVPESDRFPTIVTPEIIQTVVSEYFNVDKSFMSAYSTYAQHVEPRQLAIYLTHKMCGYSKSDLGRLFKRNHSSIINSLSRVQLLLCDDERVTHQVAELTDKCLKMAQSNRQKINR